MEAKFEVKMTQKVMYNFLLNHTYRSAAGVVDVYKRQPFCFALMIPLRDTKATCFLLVV